MANLKNTTVEDTGAIQLPIGTTAERPSNPTAGYMRYNSTFNTVESYVNTIWRYMPDIVRSGLILNLDAGELSSYPGSGTIWTDLSGNGYIGTLYNNTSYDDSNGGALVFDGTDDFVELNSTNIITGTNPFTIDCWYTLIGNNAGELFGNYGVGYTSGYIWFSTAGLYINGSCYVPNYQTVSKGTHHIAATRDSAGNCITYFDGVIVATASLTSSIPVSPNFRIGADTQLTPPTTTNLSEELSGKIYQLRCYNRVLSQQEIQQNYYSFRGRLQTPEIVRNGLVLYLDAGELSSYPGSGTTWTDLSGNNNTATMFGSVPFGIDVAKCFDFATSTGASSVSSSLGFTFGSNMIPTTGNFTLSCWIKNPNNLVSQTGLFGNAGGADGYRFGIGLDGVYFLIAPTYTEGGISFASPLSPRLWYNVTAVYNRTTAQVLVYLNGVLQNVAIIPESQTAMQNGAPGLVRSPCCNIYTGKLSVFQAYSSALTESQIQQNFNALRGRFGV